MANNPPSKHMEGRLCQDSIDSYISHICFMYLMKDAGMSHTSVDNCIDYAGTQ